jgi:hypothetical protein
MNYLNKKFSARLLIAVAIAVSSSLSAFSDTFKDSTYGLYFETSDDGTCSVVKPTSGSYSGDIVIPSTVMYNDTEYTVTSIGIKAFQLCTSLTSVTIPESVTSIGSRAFYYCQKLASVNLPESLTSIETYTFYGCEKLTSVTIPEGVTSIESNAFAACTALTSVTIPSSTTSIKSSAFYGCTKLTSVTIPGSVTSIATNAFNNCSALTKVEITDLAAWCNISFGNANANPLYYAKNLYLNGELVTELDIPDSVTEIKAYAFENGSFTSLTLPSTITSIGTSAFSGCTSLLGEVSDKFNNEGESGTKNVLIIPNSVTTISTSAFQNCTALENLWLGNSVGNISATAFAGVDLTSVTSTATTAPKLAAKNVFSDATYADANLYIAKTADLDSYKSSGSYWAEFESIDSETILTGVDEVSTDMTIAINGNAIDVAGYEGEISIYNMSGMRVYQGSSNKIEMDNPGIYVIVISGKCYKIAIK